MGDVTVGYWYHLTLHFGLCRGPIDAFLEFRGGDRAAWSGVLTGSGTISVNKPNLWGGEDSEGGIVGNCDVMFGEPAQAKNSYLISRFGRTEKGAYPGGYAGLAIYIGSWSPDSIVNEGQSAYRGRVTFVFKGGKYGAMNPYPKAASFKVQRLRKGWDGDTCWYPETVEVGAYTIPLNALWRYREAAPNSTDDYSAIDYDDTQWPEGPGGFGNGHRPDVPGVGTVMFGGRVPIPKYSGIWIRKRLGPISAEYLPLTVEIWHDDGPYLWVNGVQMTLTPAGDSVPEVFHSYATIPADLIKKDGDNVIAIKVVDSTRFGQPFGNATYVSVAVWIHSSASMNPAHILYDSITSSDMSGEASSMIDNASFRAAADTLFGERFGICTKYDPDQESIEDFQGRICNLIGGVLSRDRKTGLWNLDLVRGGGDPDGLPILTDDDILDWSMEPSVLDDAVNQVIVEWFDPDEKETRSTAPVQALGLIQSFGGVVSETASYPEIPYEELAQRVAARDLRNKATPLARFELKTNRVPYAWRVGTYFRLQSPRHGITDMVCMVSELDIGTLDRGAISLTAIQDIFAMPATTYVVSPGQPPTDVAVPGTPAYQRLIEAPYFELVSRLSTADLDYLADDAGYILAMAGLSAGLDFTLATAAQGQDFTEHGVGSFSPALTVAAAIGPAATNVVCSGGAPSMPVLPASALLDDEIVVVRAIDPETGILTIGRGCADTVPAAHDAGSVLCLYSAATDGLEYTDGETVSAKILTRGNGAMLDIVAAPNISTVMASRKERPYPPGNFRINGLAYPDMIAANHITVGWNHRDRILQSDMLIDTAEGDIGPEPGTTYNITFYGETGALAHTETGLTGNTYTWDTEALLGADIALLHFDGDDGDAAFADEAGSLWTPTGSAALSTAQSMFGGASLLLDGNGYITTPASPDFDLGLLDFTIEAFIYRLSDAHHHSTILGNMLSAFVANSRFFMVYGATNATVNVRQKLAFGGNATTIGNPLLLSQSTLTLNRWHHIAVTRQGGIFRMFIDGRLEATATKNVTVDFSQNGTAIGNNGWDADGFFIGYIDELRVTKGRARYIDTFTPPALPFSYQPLDALNKQVRITLESERNGLKSLQCHDWTIRREQDIALLHFEGSDGDTTFADEAGSLWTPTGSAALSTAQSVFGGASLLLDGNSYITTPASPDFDLGLLDFTIEAFIYRTSDALAHPSILGNMLPTFSGAARYLMTSLANSRRLSFGGPTATIGNPLLVSETILALDRWYHIAVTRQDGVFRMFVDGQLEASATKSIAVDFSQNGTAIGNNGWDADGFFIGYIDELRVTKGRARYTSAFTPPNAPFVFASGT